MMQSKYEPNNVRLLPKSAACIYICMSHFIYHASLGPQAHSRSLHSVTAATPWWHSLHTLQLNTLPHFHKPSQSTIPTTVEPCFTNIPEKWPSRIMSTLCLVPNAIVYNQMQWRASLVPTILPELYKIHLIIWTSCTVKIVCHLIVLLCYTCHFSNFFTHLNLMEEPIAL